MYITINSEFKPFTYDELTKPLNDYTEAYNKVEEQYATLAQQTEAWKNIATQENSPKAYDMYKKYSDELNDVVEDFSKGMTIQNRSKLSGLKSRYASEITPIANAYNAMQEANAYRDTVKGKDDSVIFNVDRYNSLDDFLNGQTSDNNYISGKAIQDSIAKQTLMESCNKYNQLIAEGHSKRAAAKIVAQGDWIDEEAIVNNIYASSGVTTEEAANKVKSYADTGIMQGVGTFSVNADESILKEEIARIKADNGGKDGDPPKFDDNAVLLEIYDAFGGDQYEEYDTSSTTTKSFPTDTEDDYTETTTTISRNRKDLSKDRKLANARKDTDMLFALELRRQGLSMQEVTSYYNQYKNIDEYDSFESYIQSIIEE